MKLRDLIEVGAGKAMGTFRVMAHERRLSQAGRPFTRLELEDYSGRITAYAWEHQDMLANLQQYDVVEGLYAFRSFDARVVADLLCPTALGVYSGARCAAALIPRSACPTTAHASLEDLVDVCEGLAEPSLRAFADAVLGDAALWPGFVASRASKNHHHSAPGGLLIHSVDVANRCRDQSRGLTSAETELTIVAGLFHDLGKIRTVGACGARPELGKWVHHEALTLELLAPHLPALDRAWPEGGAALRHCLSWYSVKPNGFARFVGADIVRGADGCDVAMDRGQRLSAGPVVRSRELETETF